MSGAGAGRNLAMVEEGAAPAEVRVLYASFRERFGRAEVPGILKCFATHPPLLEHMMGLAEPMLFSEGALGRANKELLGTFLSARNGCAYCADSHGASLLAQGVSMELVGAAIDGDLGAQALGSAQRALLRFAGEVNDRAGCLGAEEFAEMRGAGWSELQIAEAVHVTALFACFNRVVSAFGVPSQGLLPGLAADGEEAAR